MCNVVKCAENPSGRHRSVGFASLFFYFIFFTDISGVWGTKACSSNVAVTPKTPYGMKSGRCLYDQVKMDCKLRQRKWE